MPVAWEKMISGPSNPYELRSSTVELVPRDLISQDLAQALTSDTCYCVPSQVYRNELDSRSSNLLKQPNNHLLWEKHEIKA